MKPLLVGITGGIGAGKSMVCRIFQALGAPVYDADTRAKHLMSESESLKQQVVALFGAESYENGQLNRTYIGQKAFHQPELLARLNQLVHPAVALDFQEFITKNKGVKYLIKEAALLIETGSYKALDHVVLVTAPLEVRIERVRARDTHRTVNDIKAIISKQLSDQDKLPLVDCVIRNDGASLLIPQVLKLHEQFSK